MFIVQTYRLMHGPCTVRAAKDAMDIGPMQLTHNAHQTHSLELEPYVDGRFGKIWPLKSE